MVEGLIFAALVFAAAMSGALFMPGAWYAGLNKPSWTPPNWLFAPAWSVLYIMIAFAGYYVWQAAGFGLALALWGAQLVFNAAWSYFFFGRKAMRLALIDSVLMLASIVAFIVVTWSISPIAAMLFLPYLAWVTFATVLNYAMIQYNPQETG
ncbi:MAG: TspO/MBR family protein [Pseudomonadota bacterium]